MQVTKIYQVVETCQNKCFKGFIDEMVQGRREADVDSNKKAMVNEFCLWIAFTKM